MFFNMVSITLSIPEEIKKKMDIFPEINWSGLIRKKIIEKTDELTWKENMLKKLKQEESLIDWSLKLQKESGKERLKELKRKGVI